MQLYQQAHAEQQNGHTEEAIALYRRIIAASPRNAAAYNNLGMLLVDAGHYVEAVGPLTKALQLLPGSAPTQALLGKTYVALNRFAEARPLLESSLQTLKSDTGVEETLIAVLINTGDYYSAAGHLRHIATYAPSPELDYKLQSCYLALAKETLAHLVLTVPDSSYVHELNGQASADRGDYRSALSELEKAAELSPDRQGVHYRIADIQWRLGDWPKAQAELEAELRRFPADCLATWKLANTLMQQQVGPQQLLPLLDAAINGCPRLMQAHVDRAIVLLKDGRPKDALTDLAVAEKDDPNEPSIHFQLAKVYTALNDADLAKEEAGKFRDLEQRSHETSVVPNQVDQRQ